MAKDAAHGTFNCGYSFTDKERIVIIQVVSNLEKIQFSEKLEILGRLFSFQIFSPEERYGSFWANELFTPEFLVYLSELVLEHPILEFEDRLVLSNKIRHFQVLQQKPNQKQGFFHKITNWFRNLPHSTNTKSLPVQATIKPETELIDSSSNLETTPHSPVKTSSSGKPTHYIIYQLEEFNQKYQASLSDPGLQDIIQPIHTMSRTLTTIDSAPSLAYKIPVRSSSNVSAESKREQYTFIDDDSDLNWEDNEDMIAGPSGMMDRMDHVGNVLWSGNQYNPHSSNKDIWKSSKKGGKKGKKIRRKERIDDYDDERFDDRVGRFLMGW